ncbi:MAG: hypothetical protein QM781_15295 [Chitinophagaceae bacterium]
MQYSKNKANTGYLRCVLIAVLLPVVFLTGPYPAIAQGSADIDRHTPVDLLPERALALAFLDSVGALPASPLWPNIDPVLYYENLRSFAFYPLRFYEGKGTNFCAYSAITYIPLNYDPEGFARFMVKLYLEGEARMGSVQFRPSKAVRKEAGLIKYKGALDINHAGQLWFLSLADRFKGYLNFFNRRFSKGDENTLWASTNFAKFNRMIRRLFGYKVKARGSDLIRPWIKDTYSYLQEGISKGPIFLYLNNRLLYKKKHEITRMGIPTHYVLLLDIYKTPDDKINIVYWDYGKKTLQQVTPRLLEKIIFGITQFYPEQ